MNLPDRVVEVITGYSSGELTTLTKSGYPSTFPVAIAFDKDQKLIVTTTSIAYVAKVNNLRRDPRAAIALGYEIACTSSVQGAVHIQGIASLEDLDFNANFIALAHYPSLTQVQPQLKKRLRHRTWQRLYQAYMSRVIIKLIPQRVLFWQDRSCTGTAEVFE